MLIQHSNPNSDNIKMRDGVRLATTEEEQKASFQLRYKIYVESMGRLSNKGNHSSKELRDEYDEHARAIIAVFHGKTTGTLRIFWGGDAPFHANLIEAYRLSPFLNILEQDQICIVERMMVEEKYRGSSVTLRLYKEVMHFVLEHKIEAVLLDCEPHHLNSYMKLGFRPFTTPYTYPGIGLVIPMVLITGDYEHLARMGSPFAGLTSPEVLGFCNHVDDLRDSIEIEHNVISETVDDKAAFLNVINSYYQNQAVSFENKHYILSALSENEIERLIEKSHIIECKKGDHIIEINNSAKTMFILLSGFVSVDRNGHTVAYISPGEVIGEIAFFLNIPRSASIIAATDGVRILSLNEAGLSRLLNQDSPLANKILMNICKGLCSRIINATEFEGLGLLDEMGENEQAH